MRNVWMVPVFAVLMMGFGRCEWWPPPGGGGGHDDGQCQRDRDCSGAATCVAGSCDCSGALILCAAGTVFDEDPSVCECVPEETFCGGFAGIACPGAGMCVDDPGDDCDPENGGADCGGLCECNAAAISCPSGSWLNEDPAVCECVPVEDPAPACAGFLGLACPGEGDCTDEPSDDCDPSNGGADCSGLCECNVGPVIDCGPDNVFDDSPFVCACVPTGGGEPCGDVTCGAGTVCCNASCGICTPPDGACIQIACE